MLAVGLRALATACCRLSAPPGLRRSPTIYGTLPPEQKARDKNKESARFGKDEPMRWREESSCVVWSIHHQEAKCRHVPTQMVGWRRSGHKQVVPKRQLHKF